MSATNPLAKLIEARKTASDSVKAAIATEPRIRTAVWSEDLALAVAHQFDLKRPDGSNLFRRAAAGESERLQSSWTPMCLEQAASAASRNPAAQRLLQYLSGADEEPTLVPSLTVFGEHRTKPAELFMAALSNAAPNDHRVASLLLAVQQIRAAQVIEREFIDWAVALNGSQLPAIDPETFTRITHGTMQEPGFVIAHRALLGAMNTFENISETMPGGSDVRSVYEAMDDLNYIATAHDWLGNVEVDRVFQRAVMAAGKDGLDGIEAVLAATVRRPTPTKPFSLGFERDLMLQQRAPAHERGNSSLADTVLTQPPFTPDVPGPEETFPVELPPLTPHSIRLPEPDHAYVDALLASMGRGHELATNTADDLTGQWIVAMFRRGGKYILAKYLHVVEDARPVLTVNEYSPSNTYGYLGRPTEVTLMRRDVATPPEESLAAAVPTLYIAVGTVSPKQTHKGLDPEPLRVFAKTVVKSIGRAQSGISAS